MAASTKAVRLLFQMLRRSSPSGGQNSSGRICSANKPGSRALLVRGFAGHCPQFCSSAGIDHHGIFSGKIDSTDGCRARPVSLIESDPSESLSGSGPLHSLFFPFRTERRIAVALDSIFQVPHRFGVPHQPKASDCPFGPHEVCQLIFPYCDFRSPTGLI